MMRAQVRCIAVTATTLRAFGVGDYGPLAAMNKTASVFDRVARIHK
jgi:hypothetical protein